MVNFTLSGCDFAYYNVALPGWHVESADKEVQISASSQEVRLSEWVHVSSTVEGLVEMLNGHYLGGLRMMLKRPK